jgi:hypothetical protein
VSFIPAPMRFGWQRQPTEICTLDPDSPLGKLAWREFWVFGPWNAGIIDVVGSYKLNQGVATALVPFQGGCCYDFNGSTQYLERQASTFQSGSAIAFFAHYRLANTTQTNNFFYALGHSSGGNALIGFRAGDGASAGRVNFIHRTGAGVSRTVSYTTVDLFPHVIVGRATSAGVEIYQDGVFRGSDTSGTALGATSVDRTAVGALSRSSVAAFFTGRVFAAGMLLDPGAGACMELSRNPYAALRPLASTFWKGDTAAVAQALRRQALLNGLGSSGPFFSNPLG